MLTYRHDLDFVFPLCLSFLGKRGIISSPLIFFQGMYMNKKARKLVKVF